MPNIPPSSCATRARSTCAAATPVGAAQDVVAGARASRPPAVAAVAVPKPQSPLTRVCVLAAFGPGRPWTGDLFYDSIYRLLSVDEHTELDVVVMDNSAPDDGRLWDSLTAVGNSTCRVIRRRTFLRDTTQVDRKRHGAIAVSAHVARIKNAMLDAVPADTDWVLSVEPDVEVPEPKATEVSERVTVLRQMTHLAGQCPDIGILGCPIRSRQGRHVMVYRAASLDPWRLDRKNQPRQTAAAVSPVDSVSLGLTLIRHSVLRNFRFTATPNADGTGGAGHEWSLMKHARLSGWTVACYWDIQPRHFDTPDKWV